MIRLRVSEIASMVGGKLVGPDVEIYGSVETDSRLINDGSLFVAKPGEFDDGHNFVADATKNGAIAAIVERPLPGESISQILVKDSVIALGKLAAGVLERLRSDSNIKVIGITGSNGKTSTKNMLREIFSKFGPTVAPQESYNNEVGAPISILKADESTKYLVVELGAGGLGSINYLAEIAKPDIGVVLKVGLAHVGEFGGPEITAQIKSELVRALGPESIFIYNIDDFEVSKMTALTDAKKVSFGTSFEAQTRFDEVELSLRGTKANFHFDNRTDRFVTLKILGEHQLMNAAASLAVVRELGLDLDVAIHALEAMPLAERWRMQLLTAKDGVFVINDAYNASPDSMKAALQTLATLGRGKHQTIAVLGEMAELGSFSAAAHDEIGRLVVRYNIDHLVVVGEAAKMIHLGAMQEGSWDGESVFYASSSEALEHIRGMLEPDTIVLVKSSKSANLRFLGDDLAEVNS